MVLVRIYRWEFPADDMVMVGYGRQDCVQTVLNVFVVTSANGAVIIHVGLNVLEHL